MIKYQSAAIPYRFDANRAIEVLLITSRRTRRWVFPKGDIKRGMRPYSSAAHEAFEEAGVLGIIERKAIGTYRQRKFIDDASSVDLAIHAFPLFVNTQLRTWPEMAVRQRTWMTLTEAFANVEDDQLRAILLEFARSQGAGNTF